jgi:hypothetical protein
MELIPNLQRAICALFEVHEDEPGIQRIITPLEYPGSHDHVVVRVRARADHLKIDENGEAALFAALQGGEVDSDSVRRWADELERFGPIRFDDEEVISARLQNPQLAAAAIFHVAAASQQLYALATAQKERSASDFKERLGEVVLAVCKALNLSPQTNAELPIAGGLEADYVIEAPENPNSAPLIIIAASSATRLLEAEVIHMQYRLSQQRGFVLAVAESEKIVGKKQFHRANYYTGKTVEFSAHHFGQLLREQLH